MPVAQPAVLEVFEPAAGTKGEFRKIALVRAGSILIDQNFQREVNPAKLEKMGTFSYYLTESITVVERRDGTLVAVEGQHRVVLLQSEDPDSYVWCVLLDADADEAGIALAITRSRTQHSQFARWQLELARGDAPQVAAQQVLERIGVQLSNFTRSVPGERRIAAVAAVRQIMRSGDSLDEAANLLDTTLSTIKLAFIDQQDMWAAPILKAVSRLIESNPGIDTVRLAKVLAVQSPERWLQERAHKREGQPALECVGQAMVAEYNRGLRVQTRIAW